MASRVFASRLASQMATKAARPAMRAPVAAAKRTITTGESKKNFFPQQMEVGLRCFDRSSRREPLAKLN